MSYKVSAKNRKFKRILISILSFLKFESLNTTPYHKIIIIWIFINIISLFFNWIESTNQTIMWNSFENILWITWYILLLINLKLIFLILSQKQKEIIKNFFNINIKDWIFIVILWMVSLLITINSIFIIEWFSYFQTWLIIWKWIVLSIIWSIFIILWWFFILKTKTNTSIYVEDKENENNPLNKTKDAKNMKLPF